MSRDTVYTEQALAGNDEFFDEEGFETATTNSYAAILERLGLQGEVAQNLAVPNDDAAATSTYVSRAGFDTLFAGDTPRMLYVPEGNGARDRPEGAVVDQIVLHSFGYAIDRLALRSGARSIQVDDPSSGHNPYKVAQRLDQVLFGQRQSTSHIITRRGDIISATPWNRAPAVNALGAARPLHVPDRSISVELESWHTAYKVSFRDTPEDAFKVLGQAPYTPAQLTALAFLMKKLGVWSDSDVTTPMGFRFADVRNKLGTASGHVPGIVNASALADTASHSPGGEFEYPIDWELGGPLPSHLNEELYTRRNQLYHANTPAGTRISHYFTLKGLYDNTLPVYAFQTELFETRAEPVFEGEQTGASGAGAAAQSSSNARGSGFARSEIMQTQSRTGLYSAAAIAADAVIRETQAFSGRQATNAEATPAVPVIQRGLAFDFASGQWVVTSTTIVRGTYTPPTPRTPPAT